jgi:hypothetical protein
MRPASWFFIIAWVPSSFNVFDGLMLSVRTWPSNFGQQVAHERLVAKRGLALGIGLRALALLGGGERRVRRCAHLEREQELAAGRLLERELQLVRVRLVGEVLVRGRQRERQRIARQRFELGLRRKLRGHARELQLRHERRPRRRVVGQGHDFARGRRDGRPGGDAGATGAIEATFDEGVVVCRDTAGAAAARSTRRRPLGRRRLVRREGEHPQQRHRHAVASSGAISRSARPCAAIW